MFLLYHAQVMIQSVAILLEFTFVCKQKKHYIICDWIWENPASTHNYKYLEIPNLIIWNIITQEGK